MTDVWASTQRPTGRRLALDLAWTVGFTLLAIAASVATSSYSLVTTLVVCAALIIRRLWLVPMIALAIVGGVAQLALPEATAPVADLAYAPMFFVLGGHREERVRRFGLVAAVVAVIVGATWAALTSPGAIPPIPEFSLEFLVGFAAVGALITLGGWVAGYAGLQSRERVQATVDAQLEEAERRRLEHAFEQEQERSRIAADMHDVVAHSWAVVAAQADGARYALRTAPDEAERALVVIGDTARTAIADLRDILHRLRYQESRGSTPGFEQHTALIDRMRASGMTIDHQREGTPRESSLLALTSYRLLSEGLTNALKHGDLTEPVTVVEDWRDGYRLAIRNRVGSTAGDGTGHGVIGMIERAQLAGGDAHARRVGADWWLDAHVPPGREETR
ncbi:two-component sensor histidine kinase [Calidifontibacter sp. DB0510]|uniref:histidine kinase n=1 Tax=Metallococcus carri TaxID=1656884 RepID=A0A967EFQ2_9MICO|nr:histidine kinase [Metallococcus carri]NHN54183.1 two-component sensor histidine kinase [Metallococcus carri]NOP36977.1 two-component sensor histidine kinase [Calidifontibacter sp. DB2511S]